MEDVIGYSKQLPSESEMSSEEAIGTAIGYTGSELELLDANCLTALSFREDLLEKSEKELIDNMGRRAKARRRAARVAAENQAVELVAQETSEEAGDETDCEIPSIPVKKCGSKIPVLQKGYKVTPDKEKEKAGAYSSPSKIPRPMADLVYVKKVDDPNEYSNNDATSTDEPTSFTPTLTLTIFCQLHMFTSFPTGSFTSTEMISGANWATMPDDVSPLPECPLSSEFSTKSVEGVDKNQVVVMADAGGTELKFDTGSFTSTEMISGANWATMPDDVSPLPECPLSSEFSTKSVEGVDKNQVVVMADAGGTELKFDVQAMLAGLDLSLVGLRFL